MQRCSVIPGEELLPTAGERTVWTSEWELERTTHRAGSYKVQGNAVYSPRVLVPDVTQNLVS